MIRAKKLHMPPGEQDSNITWLQIVSFLKNVKKHIILIRLNKQLCCLGSSRSFNGYPTLSKFVFQVESSAFKPFTSYRDLAFGFIETNWDKLVEESWAFLLLSKFHLILL